MFSTGIPLRWNDLDAQGHVNNVVYLDYLQEARVEFLNATGAGSLLSEGVVVASHQVEYLQPVAYSEDPLQVRLVISELGASRFQVSYDVFDHGRRALRARTVCCPFDFAAQRPRRLRPDEREALQAHVEPAEPFVPLASVKLAGRGTAIPLKVRWSDQDRYRHVNNVRFLDYFQDARLRLLLAAGPLGTVSEPRFVWYIVRQDVRYLTQLDYRVEPYRIRTVVTKLGTTSLTLHSELCASQDPAAPVYAEADCVMVAGDLETGRPTPLTDEMRASLQPFLLA